MKVEGRMSETDYIRLLSQTLVPYIQSLGLSGCQYSSPQGTGNDQVDGLKRREENGGVASIKFRSKSN